MNQTKFDAVIVGGGHNGLIAACYLGLAGRRVLVLEKNDRIGGATHSQQVFPGVDARLSVYSYLISLLPRKILTDLGIYLEIRRRSVAAYTPVERDGAVRGLLVSNTSESVTRESFVRFTGDDREYRRYCALHEKLDLFARKVWPTLLEPLPAKETLQAAFRTPEERAIWDSLVEKPLGALLEDHLSDDAVRGLVFTDAKVGVPTHPDDPTLLQNRTFLYHIIGQGTGEWSVPVGGMGALVAALEEKARSAGVIIQTGSEVVRVEPGKPDNSVVYRHDGKESVVDARFVLFNASSDVVNGCLPGAYEEDQVPGSAFKINMVLKRLPALKDNRVSPRDAFTGTFHIDEGYEAMKESFRRAQAGVRAEPIPGEMYCHSLTDPSILSPELQRQGYQTLTLFGLDTPYGWFTDDNARVRDEVLQSYLRGINRYLAEDIRDCLAVDANGQPCIEAHSPVDLESELGLPQGNIFHGDLTWPFAEREEEVGAWGVETAYENVLVCGSSAKRGGAVSGIPGHNAAMKVLSTD